MKKFLFIIYLLAFNMFNSPTIAAEKVVVIPLGGAKSNAGQSCLEGGYVSGFDENGNIICQYPTSKYIFVTDSRFTGYLGGVNGANAKCQAEADGANLEGTYKAWLSDDVTSPQDNFTRHQGNYITSKGIVVANGWADLTDGSIDNQITLPISGEVVPLPYQTVWTNTSIDGSAYPTQGDSCDFWVNQLATRSAMSGKTTSTGAEWTNWTELTCDVPRRLYCVEQ